MAEECYRTIALLGERFVSHVLRKNGFCIEKTNYRYRTLGEIDILASKDYVLYSIEVKTCVGCNPLIYQDKIDRKKFMRVIKLTEVYNRIELRGRYVNIRYFTAFVHMVRNGNQIKYTSTYIPMEW
jgi:Holliday junction resolvase-like predicted endonuclease